ncbi:hypothetical protein BJY52DRAFT_1209647 [Lactarius psammicola]|nr:hypothetical protein BJY52DRAFT_1209647 [Lactarius psammicola]
MAPRIVSWSDNEISISPVPSSASIVSFDSTFSDTYPNHSLMSPTASEAPGLPYAEFGAKHTGFSEEAKIPRCGHGTPDGSFKRHDTYFFKDGNVTFLIDGMLYCVHRYFFSRDSIYFSTRFAQLGIRDHEALPTIISISDIERKDFEALLSVLYPASFEAHELTYEQWRSVLHLSTRWGFASLRKLALKSIKPPTSHVQFVLARTYSIDHWVLPALTALCKRTLPLSLDEARQMSMEDVILVATVREEIRGGALRVDATDIRRHVEVAQAGKLSHPVGKDIYWDRPKSGSTGEESDSTMTPAVNPSVEAGDAMAMGATVASHSGSQQMATKEGDTDESDVERSSKKVPVETPGVEQPHVAERTSTGGGGWGSATGNNSRSNSGWFGMDPMSKSVNASTTDLLSDCLNADSISGHAPAESGGSQLPPLMGEAPGETPGEGTLQEEAHTGEHFTVKTDVPDVADVATAGVTTAGDSPEGGEGGGGGEENWEKMADDEWGIPVKMKKKKGGTAVIPGAGGGDDCATAPVKTRKKKKIRLVTSRSNEGEGSQATGGSAILSSVLSAASTS